MLSLKKLSLRKALLPMIVASWLTGCASPASEPAAAVNPCAFLPLHTYTDAENAKLAEEVGGAPADAEWPSAITDYVALRDAVKACRRVK